MTGINVMWILKMLGNFDYLWDMFPCKFCDVADHCVANCEQNKDMVKKMDQIIGIKHEEPLTSFKTSLSMGKRKHFCTHCNMYGHQIERCWKCHP